MPRPKAIVLISGGMDSLVTAAIASRSYEVCGLHLNYRHRTEERELKAFKDICRHYGVRRTLVADVSYLARIGGSALTDRSIRVPRRKPGPGKSVPATYVPFRNTHLIAIAVSWAEVIGAKRIFIGAVEEDGSGYPDCREAYYRAYGRLISLGTRPGSGIRIVTPLIHLKKSEIVQKGASLGAPFGLSWSCYSNNSTACGVCESCRLRLRGFSGAGMEDPLPYKPSGRSRRVARD
jgi:7-cyano-7-deazaguanine synthase